MKTSRFPGLLVPVTILVALMLAWTSAHQEDLDDQERSDRMLAMYADYAAEFPDVGEVSPLEARTWAETGEAVFIDVRAPEEQGVSMIPGALDSDEFLERRNEFQGKRLVAYCTIGYRSGKFAMDMFRERGLRVLNLAGGVLGWTHAGGGLVTPDGEPTNRIHVYGRTWNLAPRAFEPVW